MERAFMSLEEFMMLPDSPIDRYPTPFNFRANGPDWINLYRICRSSYLRFGDDGPPIDSTVVTLVSGHGGGPGMVKKLVGVYPTDDRFFALEDSPKTNNSWNTSIAEREIWWRVFRFYETFSTALARAFENGITRQDLKNKFPEYQITDDLIDKWMAGQFVHWNREDAMMNWFRSRGVLV